MKITLISLFFLAFMSFSCFSQTTKTYLDAKGNVCDKPNKAIEYILVTKIGASAYILKKYTIRDTIIMQGTFADSLLTIPEGKFTYYKKEKDVPVSLRDRVHINTNNYIQSVGYFLKGEKSGVWVVYAKKGVKAYINTYEHGKLNGLAQYFHLNRDTVVDEEGYFVDDKKEGEWKTYDYNISGKPTLSDIYLHGSLIQHIEHYKDEQISKDVDNYFRKALDPLMKVEGINSINVSFTISPKGEIVDITVNTAIEKLSESDIAKAFSAPPLLAAPVYDNVPVSKRVNMVYSNDKDSNFAMTSVEKIW